MFFFIIFYCDQQRTIILQIITLLHVSTLSCHPCQVTQVFQMQLLVIQFTIKMFHIGFMQVLKLYPLKSQYCEILKILKFSYLQYVQFTVCTYGPARQQHQHTDCIYGHHTD